MAHYEQVVHSPLRLQYPMKRIGKKGVGQDQYVRISWDEALDTIVNNFKETIILMVVKVFCVTLMQELWGLYRVLQRIIFSAALVLQTRTVVFAPLQKRQDFQSVYGDTLAIKPQEAQHSDLIVLWGINATATDVHILHDVNIAEKEGCSRLDYRHS